MISDTVDTGHIRFYLDGVVKTLSRPVTGAALHAIAGCPAYLVSDGKDVPNNNEHFDLKQDQDVYTKPLAAGIDHRGAVAAEPVKDATKGPRVMDTTTFRKD